MFANSLLLFAEEQSIQWGKLGNGVFNVLVFAILGIVLAIVGFKLFDMLTPGKLDDEILQKQNIAAAILAGAFILGICIIVAAAIHG